MKKVALSVAVASAILMTACGGGGGESAPINEGPTQGFFSGKTADGRDINGAVLPDGTYYVLYTGANNSAVIDGFIQGIGSTNGGKFTSADGRDYNFRGAGVIPISVSADFKAKTSLNGTVSGGGQVSSFTSTYSNEYEKLPSLNTVAGTYSGFVQDAGGRAGATISIATNGTVSGTTTTGCTISGSAEPSVQANAYALGVSFSGAGCVSNGLSVGGAAFYNSIEKTLYAGVFNGGRTMGAVFLGAKP